MINYLFVFLHVRSLDIYSSKGVMMVVEIVNKTITEKIENKFELI
jgi:hypothetical protein